VKAAGEDPAVIDFTSPGRFPIANPAPPHRASRGPACMSAEAGIEPFESQLDACRHAVTLVTQARRSLCLCSPDLEPWLYNRSDLQRACLDFLLAHPRNRLRILIADPSRIVQQGHLLLTLARRLTSSMQIRTLHPDYPTATQAFLLADEHSLMIRPEPGGFAGYVLYQSPARARALLREFDNAWDHSLSDPDLRSFLI